MYRFTNAAEPGSGRRSPRSWFADLPPICAFVFIKFTPREPAHRGLEYHSTVKTWIERQSPAIWLRRQQGAYREPPRIVVFGEFRWNDLVIVVGHSSMKAILSYVLWLRSVSQADIPGTGVSSRKARPVILTTYTMPSFQYERWWRQDFNDLEDRLDVRMFFDMHSGYDRCLHDSVVRTLKKFRPVSRASNGPVVDRFAFVPGQYDFELDLGDSVPLGRVLRLLQVLRDRSLGSIPLAGTRTSLALREIPPPGVRRPPATARTAIKVLKPAVVAALQTDSLGRVDLRKAPLPIAEINNALNTINTTIADALDSKRYEDLWPCIDAMLEDIEMHVELMPRWRKHGEEHWRLLVDRVQTAIDSFWRGFAQRSGGGRGAVSRSSELQIAFGGSLDRIVRAASTVPRFVMQRLLKDTWGGFLVVDPLRDFSCLPYGVLVLPRRFLFSPLSWWLLAHETAHDYATKKWLLSQVLWNEVKAERSPEFRHLLRPLEPLPAVGTVDVKSLHYYLTEAFCDLVGARAAFGDDSERYLERFWASVAYWLDTQEVSLIGKAAVRSIVFLALWRSGGVPGTLDQRFAGFATELAKRLAQAAMPEVRPSAQVFEDLPTGAQFDLKTVADHWPLFEAVGRVVARLVGNRHKFKSLPSEITQSILRGVPVTGLNDPLGVLYNLLKYDDRWDPVASDAALIMTLWDIGERL
jgi:hypothetical protein